MNIKAAAFGAIICLLAPPACAQLTTTHAGGGVPGPAYTGPGDAVSGAKVFYGLRAYNAAFIGSNILTVRRASDNTTMNIVALSSGALDIATANTFAGTDATATCTIATTTATCTGASSTPHVGSTITGAGLTQPCFASAVGTFTGGAGTVTVSNGGGSTPCGTISSGETLTFQYGLYVTQLFDQSGNGNICNTNSSPCTEVQATTADQAQLFPLCPTLPCLHGDGAATNYTTAAGVTTGSAMPVTWATVVERLGTGGAYMYNLTWQDIAGIGGSTNSGKGFAYGGSLQDFTASDNADHAISFVMNSSSSISNVDGTETSSLNPGSSSLASGNAVGLLWSPSPNNKFWFNGYWQEAGLWFSAWSSGNRTAYCHNARLYWGTGGSC